MKKIPSWLWWTLGLAAAGGVGYLVLRPAASTQLPPSPGPYPEPLPRPRAPLDLASPSIPGPMPDVDGFTDFFTPESEKLISSALESWKVDQGISVCTAVEVWDAQSQTMLIDYFEESRAAALAVLDKHYPLDGGKSWTADPDVRPEWAAWLLIRVERMAEKTVCGFEPVT